MILALMTVSLLAIFIFCIYYLLLLHDSISSLSAPVIMSPQASVDEIYYALR